MEDSKLGTLSADDVDALFGSTSTSDVDSDSGSDSLNNLNLSSLVSSDSFSSEKDNQEFHVLKTLAHETLLEVSLDVIVELGCLDMYIKDLLRLSDGSIIDLGRSIHQPVNILLNNRPIGKGEIVVSDEDFGIRILELFLNGSKK